jgi:NAD(P) transhydrogenase subunit beta
MHPNLVALLYLAAGVLFIWRSGSVKPGELRRGNLYGMVGMTIAVVTTLAQLSDTACSRGC